MSGALGHHPEARLRVSNHPGPFRSEAHWDRVLTSDVKLSDRFETVRRTIYALGFTCVVIMGLNRATKEDVAIKVILKSKLHTKEELSRALFELDLVARLNHPHIIPFVGGEETNESIIIITPLAKGDLHSLTVNKVLGEENCRRLCKQLLEGLKYLHSLGYVHGDMKPENVLIFQSTTSPSLHVAKICDFGFTEKLDSTGLLPYRGMRGSYGYFSPEQLNRRSYGQGVDIFALGIMIYTLLSGYEPFYPTNKAGLLTGDEAADSKVLVFDSPYWDDKSSSAKQFLMNVLHGNPSMRYTAEQALNSEWIKCTSKVIRDPVHSEDSDIQFE